MKKAGNRGSFQRVFFIVLDGFGIGAAADAAAFGDAGASTLKSVWETGEARIPHLLSLGLGNIDGIDFLPKHPNPRGVYARLSEQSGGKDTTVGHWELAGLVSKEPHPTYPNGFPNELLSAIRAASGRDILCNLPYSGTEVIRDYGAEHMKSGALIVYTSADSVCQIAAHESVVPPNELYDICLKARAIFSGKHAVGRIIARPFEGEAPHFRRTARRRDFSLEPPDDTLLDIASADGYDVIAVGKIEDIFTGHGITRSLHTSGNREGMQVTEDLLREDFCGIAFVNLVDFDMIYGHRRNAHGYAAALSEFDSFLGRFLDEMRADDLLIISADHGTDPGFQKTTDHTREDVPFLAVHKGSFGRNGGSVHGFGAVSATISDLLNIKRPRDAVALPSFADFLRA